MKKLSQILVICISMFLTVTTCHASSWGECADDLDDLQRAASDANDDAEEAENAHQELEDKKEELENCINYPDIYDLMKDNCQNARSDYDSAKDDYASALSNLESELNTVEGRVRSVQYSCGYEFSTSYRVAPSFSKKNVPLNRGNTMCELYKKYKNQLPLRSLLKICIQSMSESECKKCLGIE